MISGWGREVSTQCNYARLVPSAPLGASLCARASFRPRLRGRLGCYQRVLGGGLEQKLLREPRPKGVARARNPAARVVLPAARLRQQVGPHVFAAVVELPALLIDDVVVGEE